MRYPKTRPRYGDVLGFICCNSLRLLHREEVLEETGGIDGGRNLVRTGGVWVPACFAAGITGSQFNLDPTAFETTDVIIKQRGRRQRIVEGDLRHKGSAFRHIAAHKQIIDRFAENVLHCFM